MTRRGFESVDDHIPAVKPRTLDGLIAEIEAWQRATFPKAKIASAAAHLHREAMEVLLETSRVSGFSFAGLPEITGTYSEGMLDKDKLGSEVADAFHLLVAICYLAEIDLFDVVSKKFAINQSRKWGEPDAQGVVEHVE